MRVNPNWIGGRPSLPRSASLQCVRRRFQVPDNSVTHKMFAVRGCLRQWMKEEGMGWRARTGR